MKICSKCKKESSLNNFSKDNTRKSGIRSHCKNCVRLSTKLYDSTHRKEKSAWMQKWRESDRKRAYEVRKKHRENPIAKARRRELDILNKDKILARQKAWTKNKYKNDINFKIDKILRARFMDALSRQKLNISNKLSSTKERTAIKNSEVYEYIEKEFLLGMEWINHGFGPDKWHIDHIVPLSLFCLELRDHQLKAFHYTNLISRWSTNNLTKSDGFIADKHVKYMTKEEKLIHIQNSFNEHGLKPEVKRAILKKYPRQTNIGSWNEKELDKVCQEMNDFN